MGLKQSELAARANMSAAYLNLIEHNHRRVAGHRLSDIARALDVDPRRLSDEADEEILRDLAHAARGDPAEAAELGRIANFAGRYPGWASLTAKQWRRIEELERMVARLTDRLTHDPDLAEALHDILSTVTAIRSSVSILNQTPDIEPHWRDRFQRNIFEEAERLTSGAQQLVNYLEDAKGSKSSALSSGEEFEVFLRQNQFAFPAVEARGLAAIQDVVRNFGGSNSSAAKADIQTYLAHYAADAAALPLAEFMQAAEEELFDPGRLASRFGVPVMMVFRRLAALPDPDARGQIGFALCDASGALTLGKPTDGFDVPSHGSTCPLWPIYEALIHPGQPVGRVVETQGRLARRFTAIAFCQVDFPRGFKAQPRAQAAMVVVPETRLPLNAAEIAPVGTTCSICARDNCDARREPSVLSVGL